MRVGMRVMKHLVVAKQWRPNLITRNQIVGSCQAMTFKPDHPQSDSDLADHPQPQYRIDRIRNPNVGLTKSAIPNVGLVSSVRPSVRAFLMQDG